MGYLLFEKNEDVRHFEDSLKMAKEGITAACEIFEDMKDQFSERNGYGERYSQRYSQRGDYGERGRYSAREMDEMQERRYRDSMGRFR